MNAKKAREMADLLKGLPVAVKPLPATGVRAVEEHGETFAENARGKALGFAAQLNACVVADDSGIEVDALGGRPGVRSARYGGPDISDEDRVRLLLAELKNVPDERRTARFRCFAVLAAPACPPEASGKVLIEAEGKVEGRINHAPRGRGGFGYDPVFVPQGFDCTFAEMPAAEKHKLSHRGQALRELRRKLARMLKE